MVTEAETSKPLTADELRSLLEAEIPTASLTPDLEEYLQSQKALVNYLAEKLGQVVNLVMQQKGAIEMLADIMGAGKDEVLIGIKPPAILMPGKPN